MFDESKAINAKDIVENPDAVAGFARSYVVIRDPLIKGVISTLMIAIDIFTEAGWEVIDMTYTHSAVVLLKNPNYKRKNQEV